jgi:porphobilinogen deaminase
MLRLLISRKSVSFMTQKKIVVATRRSALALAQARAWMRAFTQATQIETEELQIVTTGDRIQDRPLNAIGGKGLFIKEIEEAILDGRADIAVHSLKDVPAQVESGLRLGCFPPREEAGVISLICQQELRLGRRLCGGLSSCA